MLGVVLVVVAVAAVVATSTVAAVVVTSAMAEKGAKVAAAEMVLVDVVVGDGEGWGMDGERSLTPLSEVKSTGEESNSCPAMQSLTSFTSAAGRRLLGRLLLSEGSSAAMTST